MRSNIYADGTYAVKVQGWHATESPWKASKVLQMLERHHLSLKSICDIGCGAGQVLVELQNKLGPDLELKGFDISPQAISMAKSKENSHLKFYNQDFLSTEAAPFDLLLLLDVFEHVPDYMGFLESIRKRAGWIIFHIPLDITVKGVLRKSNWMLLMREGYGHLHYFTKQTALAVLSDVGFKIIDYFYTDDYEISDRMIPTSLKPRIGYEARKYLYLANPALAASICEHFNLLLLAKGDSVKR